MNNCNYMYVTKINKFAYIAEQHALMYTHLQPFVCGVRPDPRAGGGVDGGGCSVISAVSRRRVGCFSARNRRRHQRFGGVRDVIVSGSVCRLAKRNFPRRFSFLYASRETRS